MNQIIIDLLKGQDDDEKALLLRHAICSILADGAAQERFIDQLRNDVILYNTIKEGARRD